MSASLSHAQLELGELRPEFPSPLELRFRIFDEEHPDTFRALVWLVRENMAKQRGEGNEHPGVGAKAALERLRWRDFPVHAPTYVITAPSCDNSFASRYARKIAEECPDLADAFVLRELAS